MKSVKYLFGGIAGIAFFLIGCSLSPGQEREPMKRTFFAMNTPVSFTVYGEETETVMSAAEEKINELERLWSVTRADSELYALNHADGDPVTVSSETAEFLQFSLDMAEHTDGALDITIYPVLTAWGFTMGSNQIPEETYLAKQMELVGHEKVSLSGNTVCVPSGMQIDFGAVGKGCACDFAAEIFEEHGVESAVLNLGGGIRLIGSKPDGSDFKISLQHPEERDSLGILELSDTSIVTSGAYQRFFVGADGKKYGHILDPQTGYPAESGLASATIVAKEGRLCDALSTSVFVMGLDRAEQLWRERRDFEMLLVTENGEIYLTEGLEEDFTLAEQYRNNQKHIIRA